MDELSTDLSGNGKSWNDDNKKLLEGWASKAEAYRWMHYHASAKFSQKSQILTILIAVLSYFSGGSVLGSSTLDNTWFKYLIGYAAIVGGVLTNVNGLVSWKPLADKHKVISTKYSSFKRSIDSMISISPNHRANAIKFIDIKRKEMDTLITNAPNIPMSIIKEYENRDKKHKLNDFWLSFYYICCCNRRLLKLLIRNIDDEEDEVTSEKNSTIVNINPIRRPVRPMRPISHINNLGNSIVRTDRRNVSILTHH